MTSSGTSRARAREHMERDVLRVAREHLVVTGAATLSLRAIARDLGVVSSAVYRYVRSRDELLTLLLVDAYTDLADTAEAAASRTAGARAAENGTADPRRIIGSVASAVRSWAVAEPARWALLYGSPVPGYAAPADRTSGPGTRVIALILRATAGLTPRPDMVAGVAGSVSTYSGTGDAPHLDVAHFDTVRAAFAVETDDIGLLAATVVYATLIGAVSLEVFGQYGPDLLIDPVAFLDTQVDMLLSAFYSDI